MSENQTGVLAPPEPAISMQQVRYRAHAHHRHHLAVLAVHVEDGRGLGVARCIRHQHDPDSADVSVTVIEDCRGSGLAAQLLIQLSERARRQGIRRFVAQLPADDADWVAEIELP